MRLGFAAASPCAVLHGASMIIAATGPKDTVMAFFNSILHGIDVGPIRCWEMPWWELVYKSEGKLVTTGIYKYMRHPQYTGIYVITLGFVIQ